MSIKRPKRERDQITVPTARAARGVESDLDRTESLVRSLDDDPSKPRAIASSPASVKVRARDLRHAPRASSGWKWPRRIAIVALAVAGALAWDAYGPRDVDLNKFLVIPTWSAGASTPPTYFAPPLEDTIHAPGRIEGRTLEIEIRPETPGRIIEMSVEEGETVVPGHLLFRLDDSVDRREYAMAQSEVKIAEARLERVERGPREEEIREAESLLEARVAEALLVQRRWERVQALHLSKAVTKQELDDHWHELQSRQALAHAAHARTELLKAGSLPEEIALARAELAAANHRLELARTQWQKTQVRAATKQAILKIHGKLGEIAAPDEGLPTMIVADTSRLYARAFVEELDAPRVEIGMKAIITVDGLPGATFSGAVDRVSPRMGPKELLSDDPAESIDTKVREVWIALDGAVDLPVGLRVDVVLRAP